MNVHAPPKVTYNFPREAFHAQKVTAALLIENKRAYVLNDLGTGKTRAVLYAFDALKSAGLVNRLLVICPLSAVRRTWRREVNLYFRHLKAVVLHGDKRKRLKLLFQHYDIYIVNHDGLNVIYDELIERGDIDAVCVDEAAVYRNGRARRTQTLRSYVWDKPYVWALTGSPMPRAVTDVWGPCSCLTPNSVPKYFTVFRDQLMIKVDQFRWKPKPGAEERAVACMQPSVRFTLDDVTELPARVTDYYEADMTDKQAVIYNAMRRQAIVLIGRNKIDALNAGAVLSKLLQIAIGYVYTRTGRVVTLDNTPRLQLILDLIDSASQKVLLFAPFKSAVSALDSMLTTQDIDHAVVTGDTPIKKREEIFNAFQDTSRYKVLLAHPACMAHSLTLTAANTTIWAGPVTSLETFHQANARTYRVGQKHRTLIAMVGGTAAEKRIYELLGKNEKLQDRFLEIVEAITHEE
jgi:SNF2 family DNA or RNA helicase